MMASAAIGGGLLFITLNNKFQKAEAEEAKENSDQQPQQEQNQNNNQESNKGFVPFLNQKTQKLEIPRLLAEREQQKQKDYQERQEEDIRKIEKGLTREDFMQMKQLDKMFRATSTLNNDMEDEDMILDPYARQKALKMKNQEYRTIQVGPSDLLKNGQMIQVSVCDPFDEATFHPTDKVIIAKHNNTYYAVGSFCGFDYTNLAQGAFLGQKLICPTCGSTYNIENGFVEQGPSIRNISSFHINSREEKIQLIMPEHVPAFALKKYLKRENIDPRTFVILGDTETALSLIDALRTSFTGKIVLVSTSAYGAFENLDIFNRKFSKLDRNEVYLVEEDYLDRANVEVVKGDVSQIDLNKNHIVVRGQKKPIEFDKVVIAWGSEKRRISSGDKEYNNVIYLEDRYAHAKCHNEILKAKTIAVLGGTFEAYQTAYSIREYLDEIGYTETEIILIDTKKSEVQECLSLRVTDEIHKMLREKRISVLMDMEITKMEGIHRIEALHFKPKSQDADDDFSKTKIEYFIKPDIVIAENGLGAPKHDLKQKLTPGPHSEFNNPPIEVGINQQGVPSSDIRFSLHYNDIYSPILAVGSCTQFPSFIHKVMIRTGDVKYNIEAGFYAGLAMLDKRIEFRYMPMTSMRLGDVPVYYVGERYGGFHEIIINGNIQDRKFVAFYVYGSEVVGFVTVGYQNLHLYLYEAMKMLIMPPASQLRNESVTYKDIVRQVLALRPTIECKRHEVVNIPSIMLAEFDDELEKSSQFAKKMKYNIDNENQIQKKKMQELKRKYDREGIEYIEDEIQMLEKGTQRDGEKDQKARTLSGARKPGRTSSGEDIRKNINIGADYDNQKNPFTNMMNMAQSAFTGSGPGGRR